jgi:hypothetical protein
MTQVMPATRGSSATSFETPDSLFTALELMFHMPHQAPDKRFQLIHDGSDTAIHIGAGEPFTRPEFDCE